eukprot:2087567-Lingulodinium_polyedra.AAC.1
MLAPEADTDALTAAQAAVVSRVASRVAQVPQDPEQRSDREALLALLKSGSLYQFEPTVHE